MNDFHDSSDDQDIKPESYLMPLVPISFLEGLFVILNYHTFHSLSGFWYNISLAIFFYTPLLVAIQGRLLHWFLKFVRTRISEKLARFLYLSLEVLAVLGAIGILLLGIFFLWFINSGPWFP